jgi:hypothetical protein
MINQKQRGNRYERIVVKYIKELFGYDAKTCRAESKTLDDAGIDICNVPLNIQCKYGKQRGINYNNLIRNIKLKNKDRDFPTIIFHAKDRKLESNELVILTWKDFSKLISAQR